MRACLALVTVLWLSPSFAAAQPSAAQGDAGVAVPPPPHADARAPSLSPDQVAADSTGRSDDPGPIDETEVAVRTAEEWLADGQRRDSIAHGVVSGYYAEMGRSMRAQFHPDLVAMTDERRRGMSIPEIALDELERYGPPEAPRGPASVYTPEMSAAHPEDPGEVSAQQQFEIHSLLNAHTTWRRTTVHVLQDREGHVLSATVTHSSDSHVLDDAATAAITAAAIAATPPPAVLGERQTIDSDWSFWAGEVVPYIGDAGCMEGPDGQGLQCSALGRPLLRTRVVLLDVHDAEHEHVEHLHGDMEHAHPATPRHRTTHRTGERVPDASPSLPTHALAPPGAP